MQFTTLTSILATIALAANGAMASPVAVPAEDISLEARAPAQLIDLWGDASFLGLKFTGTAERAACVDLPSNFRNIVTSGKARAGVKCTVWVETKCAGTGFSFNTAGSAQFPSWIDNKAKSWKCIAA